MELLSVRDLSKTYPKFKLDGVSFSLEEGYVMGFIGRNGAGKTTTLKSMLGLVHPDGGTVRMLDMDFAENELACKAGIGVVLGEVDYYPAKRLRSIADVTRRFYADWDEAAFEKYMQRFELDPDKRVRELSAGMKVKFSLALALSHNARLLILDEPTSGLDPVSRDELLDVFMDLVSGGHRSILFSTHIITDLEKCADYITYIKEGRLLASEEMDRFRDRYRAVAGPLDGLTDALREKLMGLRKNRYGFEAMVHTADAPLFSGMTVERIGLEEIMVHIERSEHDEESHL